VAGAFRTRSTDIWWCTTRRAALSPHTWGGRPEIPHPGGALGQPSALTLYGIWGTNGIGAEFVPVGVVGCLRCV
jgi:hypothetical protein